MASRVRVVDCPACGASEWIIRVNDSGNPATAVTCDACGHALCVIRGLGLEPGTEQNCRAFVAEAP